MADTPLIEVKHLKKYFRVPAGLTNDTQSFAPVDGKGNIVNGMVFTGRDPEIFFQVFYFNQRSISHITSPP